MFKRIIIMLMCGVLCTFFYVDDINASELQLKAASACLMDAKTGRILYERNGYKKCAVASTTKILTCIIALEKGDIDGEVKVSGYAAKAPKVKLGLKEGERYSYKSLLYGMMLESYNDAAVVIAENTAGSVSSFAKMMNEKAKEIGCTDSYFITPNGLDSQDEHGENVSTAVDMARIAAYAVNNKQFVEIINTKEYEIRELEGKRNVVAYNKDAFLGKMEGAFGIKTGFTGKAGYCFVGAVNKDGRVLISVVLGCGWPPSKNLKWIDTIELFKWGYKKYYLYSINLDEDILVDDIYISDEENVVVCKKNKTYEIYVDGYLVYVKNTRF